jgi:hypothetical protein
MDEYISIKNICEKECDNDQIDVRVLERTKEENDKIYILGSRENIDSYINKNEYRKAFGLIILVLERLDENQKSEFIDYYSKNLENLGIFKNVFPSK